ncbi:MAG: response regulator [Solirubrobacteraceae bacterium]
MQPTQEPGEGKSPPDLSPQAPWGRPLLAELLESIPDPVIGCDVSGRVVYWSRAARDAYGYSSQEALGRPVVKLLQTRFPAPLLEIMEVVTDLGHWSGRLVHRTRDGREVAVESRWVARYDDAGRLVGGFGIERAVRGLPLADGPAAQGAKAPPSAAGDPAQSARALAGGVVHDFNNALGIIINYAAFVAAEIDRLRTAPSDAQRASLRADMEQISTAAKRAAKLTGQLLTFTRQQTGAPGPLDLDLTISDAAELLQCALGGHSRLELALAGDLDPVQAELAQLQQTLVTLVGVARESAQAGATVTIETSADESETDATPDRHGARIRVTADEAAFSATLQLPAAASDGDGPHDQPTGEADGDDAGGDDARAARDADAAAPPDAMTSRMERMACPGEAEAQGHATILLVEDEHPTRQLCRRILSQAGYRVLDAPSGPEALELAAAHHGRIDLLLTDIVMPEMLGHHLAERLCAVRPATAVAYMSGFADAVLGPPGRRRAALIDKPFTANSLLDHVRGALCLGAACG